jgi:hypothetical protein
MRFKKGHFLLLVSVLIVVSFIWFLINFFSPSPILNIPSQSESRSVHIMKQQTAVVMSLTISHVEIAVFICSLFHRGGFHAELIEKKPFWIDPSFEPNAVEKITHSIQYHTTNRPIKATHKIDHLVLISAWDEIQMLVKDRYFPELLHHTNHHVIMINHRAEDIKDLYIFVHNINYIVK